MHFLDITIGGGKHSLGSAAVIHGCDGLVSICLLLVLYLYVIVQINHLGFNFFKKVEAPDLCFFISPF